MVERESHLKLAPINPFTPRQAETLSYRINGYSYPETASEMNISPHTAKHNIVGLESLAGGKHGKGVYGIIEELKGARPGNTNDCVNMLIEDVVFLKEPPVSFRRKVQEQISDYKKWEKSITPLPQQTP